MLQVLLGGGQKAEAVGASTTHLVGLLQNGPCCSPRQLLQAVVQQAGGSAAATALGQALYMCTLHLMTPRQALAAPLMYKFSS